MDKNASFTKSTEPLLNNSSNKMDTSLTDKIILFVIATVGLSGFLIFFISIF